MTSRNKPLLAALTTVILWAFAFPASKAMLVWFSAEQMVLLRYLVACGFYIVLFAFGIYTLPKWRDLPAIIVLGLLGITTYQLFFVHGVGRVAAGAAAMIVAANPVFASMLAQLFLGERMSKLAWCGIGISLFGVAIITFGKNAESEFIGYLMMLLAVFSISIYFVFQKPFFKHYSPLAMTSYTSIAGTLPLLYLLPQALDAALAAPSHALWIVAAMGIFSSGVGFLLWLYALSKLPAGVVTSFLFLQPLFVTIMAWWWLHEIPSLPAFVGGTITLLGVALILAPSKLSRRNR